MTRKPRKQKGVRAWCIVSKRSRALQFDIYGTPMLWRKQDVAREVAEEYGNGYLVVPCRVVIE